MLLIVGCDKFRGKNFTDFYAWKTWTWYVLWGIFGVTHVECLSKFISSFRKKCDVIINHDILVIVDDPLPNF